MGNAVLKLSGRVIAIESEGLTRLGPYSVTTNEQLPEVLRPGKALLTSSGTKPEGFSHYLTFAGTGLSPSPSTTVLGEDFRYLAEGDIVSIAPVSGTIKVLFRAASPHNSLLVTERCNHYCLMCSQPPKDIDDSFLLDEIEQLIPLVPKGTRELGFTGGEPTLAGERFLRILRLAKTYLPDTAIHVLSNGRRFADPSFSNAYAKIQHPDLMVGIPLYSDDPDVHDYIVQARGAFDETVLGILNLKRLQQRVEVRVVLHKQSVPRLASLCEYIARNLLFVDHVALMGLEMMGFTRANLDSLWIDPFDYKDELSRAVRILADHRMSVSVYNHQLCLVNEDVLPHYRQSISDWKNEYPDECSTCARKASCGGFFASGVRWGYSKHLKPFLEA